MHKSPSSDKLPRPALQPLRPPRPGAQAHRRPSALFLLFALLCSIASAQKEPERKNEQAPMIDPGEEGGYEWMLQQRAFPLGRIPNGAGARALKQMQSIPRVRPRAVAGPAGALAGGNWTSIGPSPMLANFATAEFPAGGTNYFAGSIWAVAIDPRSKNTLYAGGAGGGIWKTVDGGLNWTAVTDNMPWLPIGSIAIAPSNPDVVYAGTGGPFGVYGDGIMKSTDAGATWTFIEAPFGAPSGPTNFFGGGAKILALAVHPSNSSILLAAVWGWNANRGGIFKSIDGGNTWTQVLAGGRGSAVFYYPDGSASYAAVGDYYGAAQDGIYRSGDGGSTWTAANGTGTNTLPSANIGNILLAPAPSSPTTMYAAISQSGSSNFLGFFKTTDGGLNWFQPSTLLDLPADPPQTMAVQPTNPSVIVTGSHDFINRSVDGGVTWARAKPPRFTDNRFFVFTQDGSKFYFGDDAGIYSTDEPTGSFAMTNLNRTLSLVLYYPGLSIHPTNPGVTYGGAQDLGISRYSGVATWDWVYNCDGGSTAIDFNTPATVYATCQSSAASVIIKSTSGGTSGSWASAQNGVNASDRPIFIPPLTMDPSDSQRLYFGATRVYQTNDGAGAWQPISPALTADTSGFSSITRIAVAPGDSNVVYAGTAEGRVYRSDNATGGALASWTNVTAGLPHRYLTAVAVHPTNSNIAYVTFSGFSGFFGDTQGHIFKTLDAGAHWTDISANLPNLPLNDVVIDPDIAGTLYVGSDAGVFTSANDGGSWSVLGAGMPRLIVNSLKLHRPSRTLRAATFGRGMWDLGVPLAISPALSISKVHSGSFVQGQSSAAYTLTVSNAAGAGATSGVVSVTENLPVGLSMASMAGSGWTCAAGACTRADQLAGGASFAPITVLVNVSAAAASPLVNSASVSGGGSPSNTANDPTTIVPPPDLTVAITHTGNFTQGQTGATYSITVHNGGPGATISLVSVTELLPASLTATAIAGAGWTCAQPAGPCSRSDTLPAGGSYSPITIDVNVANNAPASVTNTVSVSGGGQLNTTNDVGNDSTTIAAAQSLRFVPVAPCRVADTRDPVGAFGGPQLAGGGTRDFTISAAGCNIPPAAQAFSLNVAVVPAGPLGYLTLWPSGEAQPVAATLNALDGRVKSNAAIVPAGAGGAISVFASNPTQVVLDVNGYFIPASDPAGLAFYPVAPCRIADTRSSSAISSGETRGFAVLSAGGCGIPGTARAYSLNFAVIPKGPLGYLTAWASGQTQPVVASLNALTGTVTANAAIVPAGTGGAISVFASNPTDLVIDINGYFAPAAAGGLSLYNVTPCRVLDSRQPAGAPAFTGKRDVAVAGGACTIPAAAQAYVFGATVVPAGALGYLTLWPQGQTQPTVATLNALDAAVTSNMAMVPAAAGGISAFASNPTHLILDIFGYFAP